MIGQILNERYRLDAELGRGGMGVVYRAHDLQLNRVVAVKVLPHEFTHDVQFLARFKNEVLNTARLQHPHIVAVYDVGVDGNTNYFVMQLIEGQDLKSLLTTRGRLPETEVLRYLGQIASALDYAHANGVVHRDIKPENILIDMQGIARVSDFGIARSMEGTRMTGGMIGTPEYMSPEQAQGIEVDGRSDQYALAIVAYEMYTGTTPFRSSSSQPWALVSMHVSTPPPDPRQYSNLISDGACAALLRALAKTPVERFASCTDFITGLSAAVVSPVPSNRATSPVRAVANTSVPQAPQLRSPILAIVLAVVLTTMAAFGIGMVYMSNQSANKHAVAPVTPIPVQPPAPVVVPPPPVVPVPVVVTTPSVVSPTSPAIRAGDYFVIFDCFPLSQKSKIMSKLEQFKSDGYTDTYLINSNDYPNFTPDLWVIVMGPYPKDVAVAKNREMKAYVSDCYYKSGW